METAVFGDVNAVGVNDLRLDGGSTIEVYGRVGPDHSSFNCSPKLATELAQKLCDVLGLHLTPKGSVPPYSREALEKAREVLAKAVKERDEARALSRTYEEKLDKAVAANQVACRKRDTYKSELAEAEGELRKVCLEVDGLKKGRGELRRTVERLARELKEDAETVADIENDLADATASRDGAWEELATIRKGARELCQALIPPTVEAPDA